MSNITQEEINEILKNLEDLGSDELEEGEWTTNMLAKARGVSSQTAGSMRRTLQDDGVVEYVRHARLPNHTGGVSRVPVFRFAST